MLRNYFKTAIRSLLRNRTYSIINILGLAAGIAVFLMIFVIIQFESSFDEFHSNKGRIFRVLTEYHHPDHPEAFYGQGVPFPLPTAIRQDFPELSATSGIYGSFGDQIVVAERPGEGLGKFKEASGVFDVEPGFFKIFDFPWLAGSPASLADPKSAALTKTTAERYFGDWHNAIGKTITLNSRNNYKITGVLADPPPNTDFQLKVVLSYASTGWAKATDWVGTDEDHACYILLPQGMSTAALETRLRAFSKKYRPTTDKDELALQTLHLVHSADSHAGNFSGKTVRPEVVQGLWLVAAFILLIACMNFINLSTAQAVNRAKEVGVRKVLGSDRTDLKIQFLLETLLIVGCSLLLAYGLARLALPVLARVLDLGLSSGLLFQVQVLLLLLGLTVIVTLLAGFYPAVVLAGFSPVTALKSKVAARGIVLRRGLVVFQFVIAQGLIIATVIMLRQMNYFQHGEMGFNKEAVVDVPFINDSVTSSKLDYLRNELTSIKGVKSVSFSSQPPATNDNNWANLTYDNAAKETDWYVINKFVDSNYLKTYDMQLVAGHNFQANDSVAEFMISEQVVKQLGVKNPEDVLNKNMGMFNYFKGHIVGVLKDFHSTGFKDGYSPVVLQKYKPAYKYAGIKLYPGDISSPLAAIEKVWNRDFPSSVFDYQFLDEKVGEFYKQERQLSYLYQFFAGIAIFLSCLGLYGLASFMAVQRIREIGIRKVLGASIQHIVALFSREFVLLIGLAFIIAAPIAWFFMHQWLQNYIYRIEINWWIFVVSAAVAVFIAVLSVSFQAVRAALSNPVKSLKAE
jgi:putative ABC transport system permease protein